MPLINLNHQEKLNLELKNGIASHDTFQRIFQLINPQEFEKCFMNWISDITIKTKGDIVSIDGKTLRGSRDTQNKSIHMINVWSQENQLVLDQLKTVEKKGEKAEEVRYFITSLTEVKTFAHAVRSHWGIENSLHWCLDVTFHEDLNRTRRDNSAENFAVIRQMALNSLKKFPAKMSLARKRRRCDYDSDFMAEVLLSALN